MQNENWQTLVSVEIKHLNQNRVIQSYALGSLATEALSILIGRLSSHSLYRNKTPQAIVDASGPALPGQYATCHKIQDLDASYGTPAVDSATQIPKPT